MWKHFAASALALGLAFVPSPAGAQTGVETAYELKLRDGSRLYGTITREVDGLIEFRTISGSLVTARREDVLSMKRVTGSVVAGEFMPEDANRTRLFFGPTGRALPRGQVYLGTFEFLMPFVQVGVTDRLSIGGGTPLMFGLDESERPFWLTPKLQVLGRGRVQAAVGAFHIFASGKDFGIAYGVVSAGNLTTSVSAGAGVGYSSDGGRSPVVMAGADHRVHRNVKLLTENYAWEGGGIVSGGVRFMGERLSADIGLGVPLGIGEFIAFPIVNFVYVF